VGKIKSKQNRGKEMNHSEILSQVEKAISSSVDIVDVTRVEKINITENAGDVIPGKVTPSGEYGVVDIRLMVPIKEAV
jgi:hypothetical protein